MPRPRRAAPRPSARVPRRPRGRLPAYIAALPDAPDLSAATRESKLLGKLDLPNVSRPAARPGLAFVGDAALASDPLWGVGCGWAFQSADWLVEETADALTGGGDLDAALDAYRQVHALRLGPHHFFISDLASARRANPLERAMYHAAVSDDDVWRKFEAIGSRRRSPVTLFAPRTLCTWRARRDQRPAPTAAHWDHRRSAGRGRSSFLLLTSVVAGLPATTSPRSARLARHDAVVRQPPGCRLPPRPESRKAAAPRWPERRIACFAVMPVAARVTAGFLACLR